MNIRQIANSSQLRLISAFAAILVSVAGCGDGRNVDGTEGQVIQDLLAGAQYSAGSTIQAEAFTSKSSPNPQLENSNTTIGFSTRARGCASTAST